MFNQPQSPEESSLEKEWEIFISRMNPVAEDLYQTLESGPSDLVRRFQAVDLTDEDFAHLEKNLPLEKPASLRRLRETLGDFFVKVEDYPNPDNRKKFEPTINIMYRLWDLALKAGSMPEEEKESLSKEQQGL